MVQDLRLVEDIMNLIAGQPDSATREEMRRHLNQDGGAPRGAPPPPPPPPGGAPCAAGTPRPAGVPPRGCAPPPPPSEGIPPRRGAAFRR